MLLDNDYVEINIPLIDQSFIGTGDLFAALLLIWMNATNNNLKTSIEKTVATVQAVLKQTVECKYKIRYCFLAYNINLIKFFLCKIKIKIVQKIQLAAKNLS